MTAIAYTLRVTVIRIILAVALTLTCVAEARATRVACAGSNAERTLAHASLIAPADGHLEAALQGIAETTGSELLKLEIISSPRADEFILTGSTGRFEVIVAQVRGSRAVIASAHRACSSRGAKGWQELWQATLTKLQQRGYTLQGS